mmetsp:Transcript_4821/g.7328  ORF Transcript_4821/g.7328 Transcript_4821/m.7328 type:complete len:91 (+) Transcript_4821:86-358(+)
MSGFIKENGHFSPDNYGRPKTSRKKHHPSPDEFADYVVPSPRECRNSSTGGAVLRIHEDNQQSGSNTLNDASTDDVGIFSCMLFGTALST